MQTRSGQPRAESGRSRALALSNRDRHSWVKRLPVSYRLCSACRGLPRSNGLLHMLSVGPESIVAAARRGPGQTCVRACGTAFLNNGRDRQKSIPFGSPEPSHHLVHIHAPNCPKVAGELPEKSIPAKKRRRMIPRLKRETAPKTSARRILSEPPTRKLLFPKPTPLAIRPLINWTRRPRPRSSQTAELCCVLDLAGMPALPALLGRGVPLAGSSGFWVGHSSGCFAVEFMSDREPGPRARLPGSHRAQVEPPGPFGLLRPDVPAAFMRSCLGERKDIEPKERLLAPWARTTDLGKKACQFSTCVWMAVPSKEFWNNRCRDCRMVKGSPPRKLKRLPWTVVTLG